MLWSVRGNNITQYLKPGYNIVRRFQREETPNDKLDCFMWLGSTNNLDAAKKLCKKHKDAEIIKHKLKNTKSS
jgi:hypothetical protein